MTYKLPRHEANVFLPGGLGPVRREVVLASDVEALEDVKLAYDDALGVSNEQGYACMTVADCMRHTGEELSQPKSRLNSSAVSAGVVLPDNLLSHRATWRLAFERLIELEADRKTGRGDHDDCAYWEHELKALDDMYADLDRLNPAEQLNKAQKGGG